MKKRSVIVAHILDSAQVEIAQFPHQPLNEDSQYLVKSDKEVLCPNQLFTQSDCIETVQQKIEQRLTQNQLKFHWKKSLNPTQLLFVKYDISEAFGCEHFISALQFYCEMCEQFYYCARCHAEILDQGHQFQFGGIYRCCFCGSTFRELSNENRCPSCDEQLFKSKCDVCVSASSKNLIHCADCGECSYFAHNLHRKCGERCNICLGGFDLLDRSPAKLSCGHQFHGSCVSKLQLAQNALACPVCRKQSCLLDQCKVMEIYATYLVTPLAAELRNVYKRVRCRSCEAVQIDNIHPYRYICRKCHDFNCVIIGDATQDDKDEETDKLADSQPSILTQLNIFDPVFMLNLTDHFKHLLPKNAYLNNKFSVQDLVLQMALFGNLKCLSVAALNLIRFRQIKIENLNQFRSVFIEHIQEIRWIWKAAGIQELDVVGK